MKHKILMLIVAVAVGVSLLAVGCAPEAPSVPSTPAAPTAPAQPSAPAAEVYNWRYATYFPRTTIWGEEAYLNDIETMSGGRINFQLYAGGELVGSPELLHAAGSGTIEMGHAPFYWFPEVDIATIMLGPTLAWTSTDEAAQFYADERVEKIIGDALAEQNVKNLVGTAEAFQCMLTTKPVSTLDEMKQYKLRASPDIGKMLQGIGVSSVVLPIEDVYLAMSTGVIDGVIYGTAEEYRLLGFNEVAKYYNATSFGAYPGYCNTFVNMDAFNSLPEDLQRILTVASKANQERYWTWLLQQEYEARKDFIVSSFSTEDQLKMKQAAVESWEELAAEGSPRLAQLTDILIDLNKDWGYIK